MKRCPDRLRFNPDVTVWMGMPVDDRVIEELPWLRKLARRLADDEADDLVQDTWLMARRYEPEVRGASGLRPWLAQAMRNRNRSNRRSSIARARREADASPEPEVAAAAEAQAIEADVVRILDDALGTLDEEQRTIVRERFFSERTAVEIAEELGIPSATVRTKLRRSLLRLREVLDERHGNDRARWTSAVLAVPLSRTVKGGVSMASTKGIVVAGAVAAVVAAGWFFATDSEPAVNAAEPVGPTVAASGRTNATPSGEAVGLDQGGATANQSDARRSTGRREVAGASTSPRNGRDATSTTMAVAEPIVAPDAVASRTRNCTVSAAKHDCDFLEPSAPVIQDMAACGVVRYDFPAMFAQRDQTPEFKDEWLGLVGASDAEREAVMQVADRYRGELFGELESIAREMGEEPWPTDMTLLDAVIELSETVGDDNVSAASRRVAEERAGQAEPPESVAELPAAERFVRAFTSVGDGLEAALADELGAERARELRMAQDGWPGLRHQTGARCPD